MAKGHIRQLKSGSWELVFDLPREPGQKRKQKSVTVKAANKKEAEAKLREILRQIDTNTYVDAGKMTLEEYLRRWLKDYCEPNLRQTTVDGYRIIIEKHLIPALGHIQLSKLRPIHIQEYYAQAMKAGRADGKGKELSPTTASHLIRMDFHSKVVCERLRHSRIGTTMDIYGHLFPGIQKEVAKQLDEKLFHKSPKKE